MLHDESLERDQCASSQRMVSAAGGLVGASLDAAPAATNPLGVVDNVLTHRSSVALQGAAVCCADVQPPASGAS